MAAYMRRWTGSSLANITAISSNCYWGNCRQFSGDRQVNNWYTATVVRSLINVNANMNLSDSQFREQSVIIRHAPMFNADLFSCYCPKVSFETIPVAKNLTVKRYICYRLNIHLSVINCHCQNYASAIHRECLLSRAAWYDSTRQDGLFALKPTPYTIHRRRCVDD